MTIVRRSVARGHRRPRGRAGSPTSRVARDRLLDARRALAGLGARRRASTWGRVRRMRRSSSASVGTRRRPAVTSRPTGTGRSGRHVGALESRTPVPSEDPTGEPRRRALALDLVVRAESVDYVLLRDLQPLDGAGDEPPVVGIAGLFVSRVRLANGGHTQLTLRKGTDVLDAICFGRSDLAEVLREGDSIDVAARLTSRTFGGFESLQLEVRDVAPAGQVARLWAASREPAEVPVEVPVGPVAVGLTSDPRDQGQQPPDPGTQGWPAPGRTLRRRLGALRHPRRAPRAGQHPARTLRRRLGALRHPRRAPRAGKLCRRAPRRGIARRTIRGPRQSPGTRSRRPRPVPWRPVGRSPAPVAGSDRTSCRHSRPPTSAAGSLSRRPRAGHRRPCSRRWWHCSGWCSSRAAR